MICIEAGSIADGVTYIKLEDGDVEKTLEVAPNLLVDVDKDGRAVGVEILNASLPITFTGIEY